MPEKTRILRARRILTMNRHRPEATHVAIRDGRILAAGGLEELTAFGDYELDDRFADKVLMPGFVEGHCHAMEGRVWDYAYVGHQDRTDPDGRTWPGSESIPAVIETLQRAEAAMDDPQATLFAWGFDPIYFAGRRMLAADLDRVSASRPVLVMHSNGHVINVNSRILEMAGIDRSINIEGIVKDEHGVPTGELREFAAKYMAYKTAGNPFGSKMDDIALLRFARSACRVGVTTATDLHANLDDTTVQTYARISERDDFTLRLVPALAAVSIPAADGIAKVKELRRTNNAKLHYGLVKIMTDGSIQGFSGRLKWPGYHNGAPNGVWNLPPAELFDQVQAYHDAGLQLHMHTNGDEASELMIDAIEAALERTPRRDHRHTLQHCQMADESQFRRMAALGICTNLFANHIFFWGDQHHAVTMGPDRASRMDAAGTALRWNVPLAIHSDAPVTPLAPLFTAWCAVNRQTMSGRVLGEGERITVDQALFAVTLGAAYTLKLDHLVGSIESGKFADFAILEDDPTEMAPQDLRHVRVWGTIVGGHASKAPRAAG
jgi:predicted amidohydrolase YtcJ